ncbi:Hypothetical protein CINCED_3A008398 [Cinara cedri]|nr:Hypothetical protein CINCED_3A008398 [Cinara cedri]
MKIVISLCLIIICFASAKNVSRGLNSDDNNSSTTIVIPNENSSQNVSDYYLADINEFPYHVIIVKMENDSYEILCQGALISHDWILTSASCINRNSEHLNSGNFLAFLGVRDLKDPKVNARELKYTKLHPNYDTEMDDGNDVALCMLEGGISEYTENTEIVYLIDPSETRILDCKYSSFIGQYLYGQSVKMQVEFDDCEKIGVLDDIYYCAVMNDTIHAKNKEYDLGSPLTCGGKLYAIRNIHGYFTTVFSISNLILHTMDELSLLTRTMQFKSL